MMKFCLKIHFFLFVFLITLNSCIIEGLAECPTRATRIKVFLGTSSDIDIPKDTEIKKIDLYLFNEDGYLIEKINNVHINQWVELDYPDKKKLQVIAFANALEEDLLFSDINSLCHISDNIFALKSSEELNTEKMYNAPGEIFKGNILVDHDPSTNQERLLPIYPIVSKINIKVKGHRQYAMQSLSLPDLPNDEDFKFIVQTKHISVDYLGNPCGNPVYYYGKETQSYEGICEVSTFNMLSTDTGESVAIYIYYNDILIDIISEATDTKKKNDKTRLMAYNGKLLEVFINYQSDVIVALQNTNWSEGGLLWKDFDFPNL